MNNLKTSDTLKSELQGDHLIRKQLYQAQTSFALWRKGGVCMFKNTDKDELNR